MISLSVVIVIAFSVIFIVTYTYMQKIDLDRLRAIPPDAMTSALLAEQQEYQKTDSGGFNVEHSSNLPIDFNRTFVVNIDNRGGILIVFSRFDMDKQSYVKAARLALNAGTETGTIKLSGKTWRFLVTGEDRESIVFLDVDDTGKAMARITILLMILAVCVMAAIFLISYRAANRAIRPVEESIIKQRQFVADASHELKTPLAIIDSNAEALLAHEDATVSSQRQWVDRIEEESDRMRRLVEDLLYLARAEDAALQPLPFDLALTAEDEINRVETVLFESDIELTLTRPLSPVIVKADEARIRQAILILLDNAVKYTNHNGHITVKIEKTGHRGVISVANTGDGIPEADLPHIFDRFYRVDKSRTSNSAQRTVRTASATATGAETDRASNLHGETPKQVGQSRRGYGLGLAIAKAIVTRSSGSIEATSSNGLTTFTIKLLSE